MKIDAQHREPKSIAPTVPRRDSIRAGRRREGKPGAGEGGGGFPATRMQGGPGGRTSEPDSDAANGARRRLTADSGRLRVIPDSGRRPAADACRAATSESGGVTGLGTYYGNLAM